MSCCGFLQWDEDEGRARFQNVGPNSSLYTLRPEDRGNQEQVRSAAFELRYNGSMSDLAKKYWKGEKDLDLLIRGLLAAASILLDILL